MPAPTERIACIDVGTNTALLLVADLEPATGRIVTVDHRQTIVRLGQKVDEHRMIHPEALERLKACMTEYRKLCSELEVRRIIAAGTSALRDAANRDEIIGAVKGATGIEIRCISGDEEAVLTFFGAVAGLPEVPEPFTVIDIGGGSTEIIMGTVEQVASAVSMNIGSVRMTERFCTSIPPSAEEFEAAKKEIDRNLARSLPPFFAGRQQVFGVAGTLTTIAQVCMGDRHFDVAKVQGYQLEYSAVHQLLERLRAMTLDEIAALGIPEGRADVFTMGTLILRQFMRMLGVGTVTVSIQGLRYGMAQQELQRLRNRS
ncbi:Ppx/GppA family phosphatase [Chlorobaculum sp. MV4-Y]|jgi:exopolyphosphatase/guanosine-5'-triphosphate,3'-diphosphate pyrophosphatase|uniref:Ppx/GppA phosphatase family protein n=1 Tax=Chlorobaculum sp. MV4-Y TaxID=2976335 RepID=UPI0021B07494|nr:Ppx/GppA phosphatase family protein [Chlorobaculum sp. MV4-Y]UWX57726.1 Ppx/GppA family phosphatase [Chlorobaculum sp. MV4-Y]